MIFEDENERNTFLEINSNGEVDYPLLEDYLALYKIYNFHNPYIDYFIPSFNFKSAVKVLKNGTISLMTLITIINTIPNVQALDLETKIDESSVVLYESVPKENKKTIVIEDVKDLDKYLGEVKVTKDLILRTIDKSEKIPEDIKKIIIEEFESIYSAHPNANYRIFYENLQTLNVNIFSDEEYYKRFPSRSAANYNSLTNSINIQESSPKDIIAHEIAHIYHSFYRKLANVIIIRKTSHTALNEGMTNLMTNYYVLTDEIDSYKISKEVLKYLSYLTDFTYEEYSRYGMNYLFQKASAKYHDINFKYISRTLNAMVSSEIYRGIIIVDNPIDMYNELFESCLKGATKNNGYEPFNRFLNTLVCCNDESLITSYLERYNERLKELNYSNDFSKIIAERIKTYNRSNCIIYGATKKSPVFLGYRGDNDILYKINEDGTLTLLNADGNLDYYSFTPSNFELFKMKVFTRSKDLEKSLIDILNEEQELSPHRFQEIPIYLDSKPIAKKFTGSLSLKVGFTSDKELGFILIDDKDKVIYQTDSDLRNLSNKVPLNFYLLKHYFVEYLELNEIFNTKHLKMYQRAYLGFNNFNVIDDAIVEESFDLVTIIYKIEGKISRSNYRLSDCKICLSDDFIFISDSEVDEDNYDYVIPLKDILLSSNIYEDDVSYYPLEMEKLEELTKNYIILHNSNGQKLMKTS